MATLTTIDIALSQVILNGLNTPSILKAIAEGIVEQPNLTQLMVIHGQHPAAVAQALGVDPALFDRVAAQAQGLPQGLVGPIAAVLGVDQGTVTKAARCIVSEAGGVNRVAYTPLPSNPADGDDFSYAPLGVNQLVLPF